MNFRVRNINKVQNLSLLQSVWLKSDKFLNWLLEISTFTPAIHSITNLNVLIH